MVILLAVNINIDKIKQEHTIIEVVLSILEKIAVHTLIISIILGRINHRKDSGMKTLLFLKYDI